MQNIKKGEMDMTDIITNAAEIFDNYNVDEKNRKVMISDCINSFIRLKEIAKEHKDLIEKYIIKDKNVRKGKAVIKGTRITPLEVFFILDEAIEQQKTTGKDFIKYIKEQYPSLDSEEKIMSGILYVVKKYSIVKYILGVILTKNR